MSLSDSTRHVTVVLPAFNEEARLGSSLDALFLHLGTRHSPASPWASLGPMSVRVLVVDDGSTDDTAELVRRRPEAATLTAQGDRLDVISVPHAGKGAAVRAGMLSSDGDFVLFADADMATPPDQIPKLLRALDDAEVALGSRIQPDGSDMRVTQPVLRRLVGRLFHALAAFWVTGPVRDTQCGFKGFTTTAARDLFARQRINSIVFDVELIYLARRRGYRVAIVPVMWTNRAGSRMRPGIRIAARVAWDIFRIPLIHRGIDDAPRP